jgi:hypothetical protein
MVILKKKYTKRTIFSPIKLTYPMLLKVWLMGQSAIRHVRTLRENNQKISGSHLQSQLLGRQRLEGSWFEASLGKTFVRPLLSQEAKHGGTCL